MKNLFIVRGLPGSGKSTLAKEISPIVLEADNFFITDTNEYVFDKNKLGDAHNWCLNQCEKHMQENHTTIAVSNTFTQEWEMEKYFKLADKHSYRVFTIVVENRHNNDSIHNVPKEAIENMKNRFQIKL
jgi:predicted kinase